MSIDKDYEIILNSNKFDVEYYKKKYGISDDIDSIYHYLEIGVSKNYNPSKNFDTGYYLEENIDVKNAGLNPFVHYILYGEDEGRFPKLKDLDEIKEEYSDKKLSLEGKNNYLFLINDSNSEILQHFDEDFKTDFNSNLFSEHILFKKNLFNKYGIKYDYFIVPDKSIVCKKLLPFKYDNIYRNIYELPVKDLAVVLNESDYFKHDTHMNYQGGKKFAFNIITHFIYTFII